MSKNYSFTIEGVVDTSGNPKLFSVPSLGRDILDEFEQDNIVHQAALSAYLDDESLHDLDVWPKVFKFQTSEKPVELSVELTYAPVFFTKQKSLVIQRDAAVVSSDSEVLEEAPPKKTRKPRAKAKPVSTQLLEVLANYEGYLTLVEKPHSGLSVFYGASLSNLDQLQQLLTSIKAVTGGFEEYFKIKYEDEDYILQIAEDFYEALTVDEVFDPTIAEEGELIEAWHYV